MIKRKDEESLTALIGNLSKKYRYTYKRTLRSGHWHHRYGVVFPKGAVEIQYFKSRGSDIYSEEYLGGVEVHYKSAPEYMDKDKPSQDYCDYLGGPCWHDGSSMAFDQFKECPDLEFYLYQYLTNRGVEYFGAEGFA